LAARPAGPRAVPCSLRGRAYRAHWEHSLGGAPAGAMVLRGVRSSLRITIESARGLRAADWSLGGGKSDPYTTCELQGRPHTQFKTEYINKTLDPVWNHVSIIEGCREGDIVEFSVWDKDKLNSDDLLGKAMLEYSQFYPNGFDGDMVLSSTGGKKEKQSFLSVKIEVQPMPDQESLTRAFVNILRADGLKSADFGGKSDPYVVCGIPGKPKTTFRTKVKMKTVNPVWEEEDELIGYEEGDNIEFTVFDYDRIGADDPLGNVTLQSDQFHPDGFQGTLSLIDKGTLTVAVEVIVPPPPPVIVIPGEHVLQGDRQPVPFLLRSLETDRQHRLAAFTRVGRSRTLLDERIDLILDSPGIVDVSREHAVVKSWQGTDPNIWYMRVFDPQGGKMAGLGSGGGHAGGGTCVDNEPVDPEFGTAIKPGSVLRFGVNELWIVERAAMQQRSQIADIACQRAVNNAVQDPSTIREYRIPSFYCSSVMQKCPDWISIVRVVLEYRLEPDEAPCVDAIEVCDEVGKSVSRHVAKTVEEQTAYPVHKILQDVRMGCTLKLRLSSDPCLMAPILEALEAHRKKMEELYQTRAESGFT